MERELPDAITTWPDVPPWVTLPVNRLAEPLVPENAEPVDSTIDPEVPAVVDTPDVTATLPDAWVDEPDEMEIAPELPVVA